MNTFYSLTHRVATSIPNSLGSFEGPSLYQVPNMKMLLRLASICVCSIFPKPWTCHILSLFYTFTNGITSVWPLHPPRYTSSPIFCRKPFLTTLPITDLLSSESLWHWKIMGYNLAPNWILASIDHFLFLYVLLHQLDSKPFKTRGCISYFSSLHH